MEILAHTGNFNGLGIAVFKENSRQIENDTK